MWYEVLKVENGTDESNVIINSEFANKGNYEIEVCGEVCNIYDIVGTCNIDEIVAAEVHMYGGTVDGQSYVVEKEMAPNLLQALIEVVFKDKDVYQEIVYESVDFSYSIKKTTNYHFPK